MEFPAVVLDELYKLPTSVLYELRDNMKDSAGCMWSVTKSPDNIIVDLAAKYGVEIIDVKACGPQVAYVSVNDSYVLLIFMTATGNRDVVVCNNIFTNAEDDDALWEIIPALDIKIGGYSLETYTHGKKTHVCRYL